VPEQPSSSPAALDRTHLASLLEDFRRHGKQTAIVSREGLRERSFSYGDLADLAARFAAELEARGIKKGDRVLIWGENCGEWIAAFLGCVLRGVIAVPIDVAGNVSFAERVIREVDPKLMAGSREQLALLEAGAPRLAFEDFAQSLCLPPLPGPVEGLSEQDAFQIVFTSGTTGDPKGVVHTHRNVLASLRPIEREIRKYLKYERIFHPLRFLHTLPLSHVFGQFMGVWIPALLAAEVHFASSLLTGDMVDLIRRERISVLVAVPRVLEMLRAHFLSVLPDLESRLKSAEGMSVWRRWWHFRDMHRALGLKFWALICGGATLPADLERFWSMLGLAVVQGYGMTETAALVSLNHPFHPARGTIGRVLPGREIRLGEDGEILVRGETVSQATWEGGRLQPRASEWLRTGDLASVDDAGNLKFRGRKKEVIVTASGLNIYPEDLEAALLRQPEIKAAAVVEAAGPSGSEPLAALILHGSHDPAAAVRAANRELAEYQHIRRWVVWPDLDFPRTSTGKVVHREVAAAAQRMTRSTGAGPRPVGVLEGLISRITGEDVSHLADSATLSEDLRLDSLGRVELQSALETQFGVEIGNEAYQQAHTLGELRQLLADSTAGTKIESAGTVTAAPADPYVYPTWPWSRLQTAIRVLFIEAVMRPLVSLLAAPRVVRLGGEPPQGPVLIVANHVTAYDAPLILYALWPRMRHRVAVAMAGERILDWRKARGQGNLLLNLSGPFQYWLTAALFNVFPLPQRGNFRKSFAHAGHAMDRGFHVMVFPEGVRSPDGLMHAFQSGSGLLWKELKTEALPVYLGGIGELKARRSRWFRSHRISICVGNPIRMDPATGPAEAARLLEEAVRKLRMECTVR
jgi:long-chain acyl-CoA synthetase